MLIVVSIVFLLVYIVTDIGNSISDDIDKESMQSSALRRSPLTSKILLRKDSGAVCLDGSPPAYYLREGRGDGQTKWFVFFEGGGWCYDPKQCWLRSKTILGSSKDYPASIDKLMKFYLSSSKRANPLMYNWNTVYVRYCDGGSFAGDATIEYEVRY